MRKSHEPYEFTHIWDIKVIQTMVMPTEVGLCMLMAHQSSWFGWQMWRYRDQVHTPEIQSGHSTCFKALWTSLNFSNMLTTKGRDCVPVVIGGRRQISTRTYPKSSPKCLTFQDLWDTV